MDLRFPPEQPSDAERAAVDAVLGAPASGWEGGPRDVAADGRFARGGHAARARRDLLLPVLHALQQRVGWISQGALAYVGKRLTVPPAEAYGVATFYHLLATTPRAPRIVHVCDDIACRIAGGEELCAAMERTYGPAGGEGTGVREGWMRSPCLGMCERAPAALFTLAGESFVEDAMAPVTAVQIMARLVAPATPAAPSSYDVRAAVPQAGEPGLTLLARVGVCDPTDLAAYRAHGGGVALARARQIGAAAVVQEVIASGLLGRGGAAFPTGKKWEAVARAPVKTRYLVCNADESEPGTFKDRVLMEEDPFALVEAMTIAAFATGCERGFIYLRGEYPLAAARLAHAIAAWRAAGLAEGFELEIRRGAGAYICGEETALFNSLEGKRGEPRAKPPFPVQAGLFGKPTVVNNVETLVNVLPVLAGAGGGAGFAAIGTKGSTGPKLFCVSGRVERPGLYEVPFGETLAQLIARAGGVRGGRALRAVLLGGAAGSFVGPAQLDTPLTFEGTRAVGASLGSGVVMVFDDSNDLMDTFVRIAEFFRDESCGQCVPCRVGTVRQEELLRRLAAGTLLGSPDAEARLLADLAQVMRDASICGLGQTASGAVVSGLQLIGKLPARTAP